MDTDAGKDRWEVFTVCMIVVQTRSTHKPPSPVEEGSIYFPFAAENM